MSMYDGLAATLWNGIIERSGMRRDAQAAAAAAARGGAGGGRARREALLESDF